MRRSKGKTRKYPVGRQQLKQQAQDESSSESSEEDHGLTFLMPSELPSVPKNDAVPTPANEVSPLPASMPTLMQEEFVPFLQTNLETKVRVKVSHHKYSSCQRNAR